MTASQLAWAMSHDWAIRTHGTSVLVRPDVGETSPRWFHDLPALRTWAGY